MFKTANEAAAGDNKLRARIYRLVKNGVLQHREESGTLKINYEQLLELLAQDAKESSSAVYAMSCAVRNEHANMPAETPTLPSATPPCVPSPPSVPAAPSPEIIAMLLAMNQLTEQVGMLQTQLDRLSASPVPETRTGWLHRVLLRVGLTRRQ
ncbi:MAG: hypothetical protein Q8O35_00255 [Humidesulfovibrio sp.]|uniref:hypothetical protein n=1 Tax=Humidesulfovibrio sp. TaxID=2910988 RepID=UPI00273628DB|nr:hypothetical protein [Humidesulfovibrio sp.]MDP2846601.1 hypothetical protein [Humidesulfovibrio sp.]